MQRVEQKVRLQLHAQRGQLRAGQLGLEPQRIVLLRAQEHRRASGVRRRDNHAVDQQLDVKVRHEVEERRCGDRSIVAGEPLDASGHADERVIADEVQCKGEHRDSRRRNRVT